MMASKVIFQVFHYDLCFSIKLLEALKLRMERVLGFRGSTSQSSYCFVVRVKIRKIAEKSKSHSNVFRMKKIRFS